MPYVRFSIKDRSGPGAAGETLREEAEMWFLSHGIATMLFTSYFDLGMDAVSEMPTDAYVSFLPH